MDPSWCNKDTAASCRLMIRLIGLASIDNQVA
jgi:hypothetical protein